MKNLVHLLLIVLVAWLLAAGLTFGQEPKPFMHPGLLHTKVDLDRMKANGGAGGRALERWLQGPAGSSGIEI